MKVYVFVVVEFCLEIRGGGMYSQAIAYAFVFLPSNRIFVTFSNRVLESDTNTLSTAYTHIFSFSLHKSLCSWKAKFFAESHFIRLNTGKEQKRRELALMHTYLYIHTYLVSPYTNLYAAGRQSFLQRAILFDLRREKNKNGANLRSCALKETGATIGCRLKFGTL